MRAILARFNNARVQTVYNVGKAETVGFIEGRGRTFGGLNLSAAIDFEFYRSTYAAQISANGNNRHPI